MEWAEVGHHSDRNCRIRKVPVDPLPSPFTPWDKSIKTVLFYISSTFLLLNCFSAEKPSYLPSLKYTSGWDWGGIAGQLIFCRKVPLLHISAATAQSAPKELQTWTLCILAFNMGGCYSINSQSFGKSKTVQGTNRLECVYSPFSNNEHGGGRS